MLKRHWLNCLEKYGVLGITQIDTRYITKMLRAEGSMMMVASTEIHDADELKKVLDSSPRIEEVNYIEQVSTKESYVHNEARYNTDTLSMKNQILLKRLLR